MKHPAQPQNVSLQVIVQGRSLEVQRISGLGPHLPELVFLHEGLGSVSHWKDFPARVAATTGCGVTVYSRYGSGNSDVLTEPRSSDSSWSTAVREADSTGALGDRLDFQSILNQFDAGHDGWAELLIHSDQGPSTTITLYLYTDLGLVPMKTPFRRDSQSPESYVDP